MLQYDTLCLVWPPTDQDRGKWESFEVLLNVDRETIVLRDMLCIRE